MIVDILKAIHIIGLLVCIFMVGYHLGQIKVIKEQIKTITNKKERN